MSRLLLLGCACLLLIATPLLAHIWYVTPDGTGDAPTIQAGIDSASVGDTVLVACGTYYEHDIVMKSGVCLRSEAGEPECVTIDGSSLGIVLYCTDVDSTTSLEGLSIAGGYGSYAENGGGMFCNFCTAKIVNCVFYGNSSGSCGGAICCWNSSPMIQDCIFAWNSAPVGGAFFCDYGSPTFSSCTFFGNSASLGSALFCYSVTSATLEATIIAFSAEGNAIECEGGASVTLTCSDVYGNAGGDWVACIAGQLGIGGNICEDPLFCNPLAGDYTLEECSPCVDGYGCGQIGAYGVGCPCGGVSTESTSWSAIKSMYWEVEYER